MKFFFQGRVSSVIASGLYGPVTVFGLAACGGGGNNLVVENPEIGELPAKFLGQTNLVYWGIDGDTGSSDNFLSRFGASGDKFEASVNVIDSDTIEFVTNETGSDETLTFNYDETTERWIWNSGSGDVPFIMYDAGDYIAFVLDDEGFADGFAVNGGFGIMTADMPTTGTATYSTSGFSRIIARDDTADPSDLNTEFVDVGGVDLQVNFDTAGISGTVFDSSGLVDLDDDAAEDDRISFEILLDGTISNETFSGTVSGGMATADIDDDSTDIIDLTLDLSNTDADGAFYGDGAALVAGSWEADFSLSDGQEAITGDMIGVFDAERN